MKRSLRTGLILGAAVIAIALCCLLFIKSPESSIVAIIQDGRELYRLVLRERRIGLFRWNITANKYN